MNLKRIRPDGFFDRTRWELLDNEVICDYTIPAGFISDGLSLPWFLRSLLNPTGHGFRAAVLHDYLLQHSTLTRKDCARAFRKALKLSNVALPVRQLYYLGVRAWDLTR